MPATFGIDPNCGCRCADIRNAATGVFIVGFGIARAVVGIDQIERYRQRTGCSRCVGVDIAGIGDRIVAATGRCEAYLDQSWAIRWTLYV